MTRPQAAAFAALALVHAVPAHAVIEGNFGYDRPTPTTTWYGPVNPAAMKADTDYVAGMRPHHAGALTMSREYLDDSASSSPLLRQLARAIIVNQQFEVLLLDQVAANLAQPPVDLPFGIRLQPMATEGMAQANLFRYEPIPGPVGYPMGDVSVRDVQFAKAMTIHHQGALDMARDYHANPAARNGFLGLFNVDVRHDQTVEIALMSRVVRAYPGNPDAITVDPSMIHGMEGMAGHGAHGAAAAAAANPHAGHVMPVADPHAGHSMKADPHAGHTMATPAPRRTAADRPAAQRRAPAKPAVTEDHSKHNH